MKARAGGGSAMDDRLAEVEARLTALAESQQRLADRVAALERRPAPVSAARRAAPDVRAADLAIDPAAATRWLALAGRTLLVLAGAFLLRALTDARMLPAWLGAALAFCYAGAWIAMAWRAGPAQPSSAGAHGLAAILVAYPLLVEATARLRLLSAPAAAALLTAFGLVALAVAAARRLQVLAWLAAAGGVLAAVALMIATGRLAPPLLSLVALGVATLWLGYVLDWFHLRWPVALVADAAMIVLALRAAAPTAVEGPRTALLVQVVLLAGYLGSFAARTLLLRRAIVDFEAVQAALAMLVGLGGAAFVTGATGAGGATVGAASAAFGAAAYAVAFAFVDRRRQSGANFHFYSTLAIVFVLAGAALLLPAGALGAGCAILAVAAAAAARGLRRLTLATHAALYAVVAAGASGLLQHAWIALLASPLVAWPGATPGTLAVLAAIGAVAVLGADARAAAAPPRDRIPRCGLVAALAVAAAGVAVGWLVPAIAGAPGPGANAGVAATVRTGVLVAGVLALAAASRRAAWREAGWLAYPLLVAVGLKLLVEDVSRSRPASLFVAFALYGAALASG
jgi:hypothetical protein